METAVGEAGARVGGDLARAIAAVRAAQRDLDIAVGQVIKVSGDDGAVAAGSMLVGAPFADRRSDFSSAVDSVVSETQVYLRYQLSVERRRELVAVAVAFGLFLVALGAWAVFVRRIRRGRVETEIETEQRWLAESGLLRAQKTEAIGLMARSIAHDVRNLNSTIRGSVMAARSAGCESDLVGRELDRIDAAANQAGETVDSLLAFSKASQLVRVPVDLASVVSETVPLLRELLPSTVELVMVGLPTGGAWIEGDEKALRQVVVNLAMNARDALPNQGRISLRVEREPSGVGIGSVVLEVIDNGVGMNATVQSRIFEPFYTYPPGRDATGLGLTSVHRTVSDHSGAISVRSAPGEGSTFSIRFTAIDHPGPRQTMPDVVGGIQETGGQVAVVAVRDRHSRELLSESLTGDEFFVVQASDATELGGVLRQLGAAVSLIVADLESVDEGGPNAAIVSGAVPVVLIVGGGNQTDPALADLPAIRVIRKPFTIGEFRGLVAELPRSVPSSAP